MPIITVDDKLAQSIKECCENQSSLRILLFLGKHPHTRFNWMALAQASAAHGEDVGRALDQLIKGGVVKTDVDSDIFYSLTRDEPLCSLGLKIAGLNWFQLQLVLKQIQKHEPLVPVSAVA